MIALVYVVQSAHAWMGRATDPTEAEIDQVAASLRERVVVAWFAVTQGVYYSDEPMTAVPVRHLSGEGDWEAAWAAFPEARKARLNESE